MLMDADKRAVVLLSGGLDSATVLGMAVARGFRVAALSFDYGQRHAREVAVEEGLANEAAGLAVVGMAVLGVGK